jgi:cytochrome c-type biogenesis protein
MTDLSSPLAFAFAFGAGLLSFVSPCVLPLVPGYLGYLSGATVGADGELVGDRRRVLLHALSFVLGFSVIFVALGASVGLIGYFFLRNMPIVQKIGGIILVAFGLHMLRFINIPFLNRTVQIDASKIEKRGLLSSSLIGAVFAVGWTPCVGLVLSGILALAATSTTVGRGALLLAVYSLGLGLPFLASALALNRARGVLRRINRRAQLVERVSGVFMIAMGLIVFSNLMGLLNAYFYRWFGNFL